MQSAEFPCNVPTYAIVNFKNPLKGGMTCDGIWRTTSTLTNDKQLDMAANMDACVVYTPVSRGLLMAEAIIQVPVTDVQVKVVSKKAADGMTVTREIVPYL